MHTAAVAMSSASHAATGKTEIRSPVFWSDTEAAGFITGFKMTYPIANKHYSTPDSAQPTVIKMVKWPFCA